RSDNDDPPFERSQSLALQALEVFRRCGERRGEATALIQTAPMSEPAVADMRLQEAEDIARSLGDRLLIANVIAARGRAMSLRDRVRAMELTLEALAMYRELGNERGIAGCLFGLAIAPGKSSEKRDYAVEAFHRYREAGDTEEAGRALSVSVMNADTQ